MLLLLNVHKCSYKVLLNIVNNRYSFRNRSTSAIDWNFFSQRIISTTISNPLWNILLLDTFISNVLQYYNVYGYILIDTFYMLNVLFIYFILRKHIIHTSPKYHHHFFVSHSLEESFPLNEISFFGNRQHEKLTQFPGNGVIENVCLLSI